MSVKRYDMKEVFKGRMAVVETGAGAFVTHSDYAALEKKLTDLAVQLANAESKCRELAAELSAVDKIHNEAVFITDDHYEQCPPEVQKIIRSLAVLQIPACDAFLAEVLAQGVEMFVSHMDHPHSPYEFTHGYMDKHAIEFAAKLRQGAAL
ncbi:hypothetical protein [Citrobacter portucalensis]|uniref:hypothetical protein n=1 Tax=Citrobacter portucalensis TaxID=1639133 RepID=UPI0024338FA3|nr:hypothetical protein [Citrobacter portucalensis]WFZ28106.1 hypothetical protein NFK62_18655 [Citrobacter portucalensis]WFZ33105.1 hypothetical protein NFK63_18645 [Citrobacter portucalensis]